MIATIPYESPLMYTRQGYYDNHITGSPIADYTKLLPFLSAPYNIIPGATIGGWLKNICGNLTYDITAPFTIITKNDKWTIYWPPYTESGITSIKAGYYYVECYYTVPPGNIGQVAEDYYTRVKADGGIVEAEQCLLDSLSELAGGYITGNLFKTEVFYVPDQSLQPALKGSFNQSFSEAFDV